MNNLFIGLILQIFTIILAGNVFEVNAATSSSRPLSPLIQSKDPHYRFHYLVKDEKTGDYKAHEEYRNGDKNITGSYMLAESNGDVKIVNYTANSSTSLKSDVNIQPGTAPMKVNAFSSGQITGPFAGLANNYYRTGISPPTKTHKPLRGLNPIVVKSLMSPGRSADLSPYTFYKETKNNSSAVQTADARLNTTSANTNSSDKNQVSISEKHEFKSILGTTAADAITITPIINTENKSYNLQSLAYLEQGSKLSASNIGAGITTENIPIRQTFTPPSNSLNQLHKMDIPSSIMEILNQNKAHVYANSAGTSSISASDTFSDIGMLKAGIGISENSIKTDMLRNGENRSSDLWFSQKENTPQRPMRLIGLNPMYTDGMHLQVISDNLSSVPQFHMEPLSIIHYAAPMPYHPGSLPTAPTGPFRNVPRSVNEPNSETPLINTLPMMNSISISAPVIPQAIQPTDIKSDSKAENKPGQSPFLLCNDCLVPSNYVSYPLVRIPSSASAPLPMPSPISVSASGPMPGPMPGSMSGPMPGSMPNPMPGPMQGPTQMMNPIVAQSLPPLSAAATSNVNVNNQKSPCPNNGIPPTPLWASYPPTFAYILMPTSIIKNRMNDTRTLPAY